MRILLYWLSTLCYGGMCMMSGVGIYYQARALHNLPTTIMGLVYLVLCTLAALTGLWFTWDCVGFPFVGKKCRMVASS